MQPWAAAKAAGRMNFALQSGRSKAGRAYLKALLAQAFAPMPYYTVSPRLAFACKWCLKYLEARPSSVFAGICESRQHVRTWYDASGVGRWVAVFLFVDGQWYWTRAQVAQAFLDTLLARRDNYIGMQELLAPILALGTWPDTFKAVLWTAWLDNQGVLHSLLKGSSGSPEANELVGSLWLSLARDFVDLFCARVESKSNVADGPTRNCFQWVEKLRAIWTEPSWPRWAESVWTSSE